MDDTSLMEQIASGDEGALQTLLRRHGALLRYVIAPILPDVRDREECLADVSVKLWQTAGTFDGKKGSLRGWLTALARNCALNRARGLHPETALGRTCPTAPAAPRTSCCGRSAPACWSGQSRA